MRVFLIDNVADITQEMQGHVVITGSHGGLSAAKFTLQFPPRLVVLNDAGGGLDDAGFSGLTWLERERVAACTVSHASAHIGDARSTLATGEISHANAHAVAFGIHAGHSCRDAVTLAISHPA